MTRRGLLAALAGAVLDPERLLWVPGRKLISIPRPALLRRIIYLFPDAPLMPPRGTFGLMDAELRNAWESFLPHPLPAFPTLAAALQSSETVSVVWTPDGLSRAGSQVCDFVRRSPRTHRRDAIFPRAPIHPRETEMQGW